MIKPTADSPRTTPCVDDWNARLLRVPAAVAAAVRQAVREHKAVGNPVAIWRDGRRGVACAARDPRPAGRSGARQKGDSHVTVTKSGSGKKVGKKVTVTKSPAAGDLGRLAGGERLTSDAGHLEFSDLLGYLSPSQVLRTGARLRWLSDAAF